MNSEQIKAEDRMETPKSCSMVQQRELLEKEPMKGFLRKA